MVIESIVKTSFGMRIQFAPSEGFVPDPGKPVVVLDIDGNKLHEIVREGPDWVFSVRPDSGIDPIVVAYPVQDQKNDAAYIAFTISRSTDFHQRDHYLWRREGQWSPLELIKEELCNKKKQR